LSSKEKEKSKTYEVKTTQVLVNKDGVSEDIVFWDGEVTYHLKDSLMVKQLEKDVEQLTFEYRKLLMWKKNQAIKNLPKPHGEHPL